MILLNGLPLNPTIFPDGTSQVWQLPDVNSNNHIEWRFEHEGELFHLAQLKTLIDTTAASAGTNVLHMPYLPYARQDKHVANDESFALRPFAKWINLMKFDQVSFCDAHSGMATILIENSVNIEPRVMTPEYFDAFCFPDKGAQDRYTRLLDTEQNKKPFMFGQKVRDQTTGYITHYEIESNSIPYRIIHVVDDLCDGGKTFEILGQSLKDSRGTDYLYLYVTHGIFSKGLDKLMECYSRIYVKHIVGSYTAEMLAYIKDDRLIVQDGALIE